MIDPTFDSILIEQLNIRHEAAVLNIEEDDKQDSFFENIIVRKGNTLLTYLIQLLIAQIVFFGIIYIVIQNSSLK